MAQVISVKLTDNTDEVKKACEEQIYAWLQAVGEDASGVASDKCPTDTGRLKNSISWATKVDCGDGDKPKATPEENTVYIGTNVEYAPYHEFGTGKYASKGSHAKKIPWGFEGKSTKWQGWHITSGVKARHYIQFGCTAHKGRYKEMLEQYLKG